MNYLDIIILLPLVYGLIRGIMRGIVQEVFALLGIILGIVVARMYAGSVAAWLQQVSTWDVQLLRPIAAFAIFMVVAIACNLLARLLTKLFKLISLGWLNRLAGGLFGALKWIIIVAIIITCIDMLDEVLHFIQPELKQSSKCYMYALQLTDKLRMMILNG